MKSECPPAKYFAPVQVSAAMPKDKCACRCKQLNAQKFAQI